MLTFVTITPNHSNEAETYTEHTYCPCPHCNIHQSVLRAVPNILIMQA